jgi:hypothetical protein
MAKRPSTIHAEKFGVAALGTPLMAVWSRLTAILGGGYRPEHHYMRGPGPKWRERHSAKPVHSTIEDPA